MNHLETQRFVDAVTFDKHGVYELAVSEVADLVVGGSPNWDCGTTNNNCYSNGTCQNSPCYNTVCIKQVNATCIA